MATSTPESHDSGSWPGSVAISLVTRRRRSLTAPGGKRGTWHGQGGRHRMLVGCQLGGVRSSWMVWHNGSAVRTTG